MPTLNYELKTKCLNCGNLEQIKVPIGSQFIESRPQASTKLLEDPDYSQSGYYRNYNKSDKKTLKRCRIFRVPALVRIADVEEN